MCFDIKAFAVLMALTDAGTFLIKSFTRLGSNKSKFLFGLLVVFNIISIKKCKFYANLLALLRV